MSSYIERQKLNINNNQHFSNVIVLLFEQLK